MKGDLSMKQKIILLFANYYKMVDERTGAITEGITSNYYFNIELKPQGNDNGSVGMRPAKGGIPLEHLGKIKVAPAIYEASFDMAIGSDGKPVLKIIDLDFVEEMCMVPLSSVNTPEPKKEKAG